MPLHCIFVNTSQSLSNNSEAVQCSGRSTKSGARLVWNLPSAPRAEHLLHDIHWRPPDRMLMISSCTNWFLWKITKRIWVRKFSDIFKCFPLKWYQLPTLQMLRAHLYRVKQQHRVLLSPCHKSGNRWSFTCWKTVERSVVSVVLLWFSSKCYLHYTDILWAGIIHACIQLLDLQ